MAAIEQTGAKVSADPSPAPDGLAAEAAAALRIEHWGEDGARTLTGLEALRHSVGESSSRHWVDLVDPSSSLTAAVARELGLHPLVAEDIAERNQRPKLELTGEHVHLVVFAISYEREVLTEEIDFVLGRNFLLTAHTRFWDPWTAQHLREGAGPLLERGPDFLAWALLDALVDAYFPVFDRLEDQIDDLEDRIVDEPGRDTLEQLFTLKRSLVEIRHVMAPQREIFNQLTNRTLPFIAPDNVIYFRDVYDHAVHLADEYDSYRELVSGALDVYLSTVNNNLSLIMKRLTGVTVVLAGIGAIGGLFGMSQATPALAGQEGFGFWSITIGAVALAGLSVAFLRRIHWI
jgi:magnesium transporter